MPKLPTFDGRTLTCQMAHAAPEPAFVLAPHSNFQANTNGEFRYIPLCAYHLDGWLDGSDADYMWPPFVSLLGKVYTQRDFFIAPESRARQEDAGRIGWINPAFKRPWIVLGEFHAVEEGCEDEEDKCFKPGTLVEVTRFETGEARGLPDDKYVRFRCAGKDYTARFDARGFDPLAQTFALAEIGTNMPPDDVLTYADDDPDEPDTPSDVFTELDNAISSLRSMREALQRTLIRADN